MSDLETPSIEDTRDDSPAGAADTAGETPATRPASAVAAAAHATDDARALVGRVVSDLRGRAARLSSSPPSPRTLRLMVTIGSIVILLVLLPAVLNASHNPVGAERARPTQTPLPPTAIPSPTAMPGYAPLVDGADGFVVQRPLGWTCSRSNPGIDCIDSPDAQNYRLQVQLPGRWTGADAGADPNDASVWVEYALGAFSDVPGRTYERVPGPLQPASFGGATWQTGAAIIGMEDDSPTNQSDPTATPSATPTAPLVRIRVQVYATVHGAKPYIIALYAADDQFSGGSSQYFQPMLQSFAFLSDGDEQ